MAASFALQRILLGWLLHSPAPTSLTPNLLVKGKNGRVLAHLYCPNRTLASASDATPRPFDVPWLVMDSRLAENTWQWRPATKLETILDEIAHHAQDHPDWLKISSTT